MFDAVYLRNRLHYDPHSGVFLWRASRDMPKEWNGRYDGKIAGRINDGGYVIISVNKKQFRAHRLAWLYVTGDWPELGIDHIDGNPSNNCWSNLRLATQAQNQANRRAKKGRLKGAYPHFCANGWFARIKVDGASRYLGSFKTEADAHAAYCAAAERHFGQFARSA